MRLKRLITQDGIEDQAGYQQIDRHAQQAGVRFAAQPVHLPDQATNGRDPEDWQNRFNLYRGSGLGLAHGMKQIGGFRPSNKDESMKNLYYVGASTIPGTGLPMVIIGSKLVTDRILQHV